jgi:hypothetical protein
MEVLSLALVVVVGIDLDLASSSTLCYPTSTLFTPLTTIVELREN